MKTGGEDSKRIHSDPCIESSRGFAALYKAPIILKITSILLVCIAFVGCRAKDPLTSEERAWLTEHDGKIIVNNETGWPPMIDTDREGNSFGIVMDFQRLIEKNLHFKFKMDRLDTWENFMERFRKGEIDVNNNLQKNPKRTEYALFTKPYIEIPNAIIVRKEIKDDLTLEKMRGMKVAVTKDFAIHDYIRNNYNYLQLQPLDDDLHCLIETSTKSVDAAVVNLAVASFIIENKGIANLRVAGYADYANALCFASRKDWPILNRILDKGLDLISPEERDAIFKKWISLEYKPFYKNRNFWIMFCSASALIIATIIVILVGNRSLKRQVRLRTEKLETANIQLRKEIDERKKTEEALRESEKRFSVIFHSNPATIAMTRLSDNVFVDVNQAWQQLTGYTHAEVMGCTPFQLNLWVYPEQRERLTERLREQGMARDEVQIRKKSGDICEVLMSAEIIELTDERYLLSMAQDITERKRTEEALRESEEKYRILIENQTDLVVKVDADGRFQFVSPSYCILFGKTEDELLGNNFMPLVHEEDRESTAKAMECLFRPPHTAYLEQRAITKDGWRWLGWLDTALLDADGKVSAIIGVGRDITERKRAEEEKQALEAQLRQAHKMEAVGTLAGGIAHEFNNILGIILGNAELAKDDIPEWNPAKFNLDEIKAASLRARDVVRQLLTFSRKTEESLQPLDLVPVVKEVIKFLRSSIPTSIEIRQNITENCRTIIADPTQIHQVMLNLSNNAAHAMEETGGTLEFSLQNITLEDISHGIDWKLQPGEYVLLQVADTGSGIPAEILDRIFDPYFTTKEVGKGTGMGLSVVHGIIENHGGSIQVESHPGVGTTFKIFFPTTEDPGRPAVELEEELPTGNERILFIDDEPSIAKLGRLVLEKLGYQVQAETNPRKALEVFGSNPERFDLIITDMTMPGMTGDQLAIELMKIRPDISVILCTGYSKKISEQRASEIGVKAFSYKPIVAADMARTVRKVLDESKHLARG